MAHDNRLERAERRLRAAEALTADLAQAVEDERTLAVYMNTESARAAQAHYRRALSELEAATNEATTPSTPSAAPALAPWDGLPKRTGGASRAVAARASDRPALPAPSLLPVETVSS